MAGLVGLVILGGIVIGIIAVVRKRLDRADGSDDSGDVVAYLLLGLAIGTAAFSLASLGRTAFPGNTLVFDTTTQVATALAGLVVSAPIAFFLWRRQSERRSTHTSDAGWIVYLALMEGVFLIAFVVAAYQLVSWVLGSGDDPKWTDVLVFGGVVVFHELEARKTPPNRDGSELPRVVGSAIGLIPTAIGIGGILNWLLNRVYASFTPSAGEADLAVWVALVIVAAPIWYYRWLRPWPDSPGTPRNAWAFVVSVAGLATALGAGTYIGAQTLSYLIGSTGSASTHFEFLTTTLSVGLVGILVWWVHRSILGTERSAPLAAYEYSMTALGLLAGVGGATGLVAIVFSPDDLVTTGTEAVIAVASILVVGLALWRYFWTKTSDAPREIEVTSLPRRFYLIGVAVVTGLTAAGALIGTLVVLFQKFLDTSSGDSLAVQGGLFVFAGLATWHLLRTNAEDRALIVSPEVLTPFAVTIICSHPGMISTMFPTEARVRVIYREDESGVITDHMAAEIVTAVGHTSSHVWVDRDGYRVAAAR